MSNAPRLPVHTRLAMLARLLVVQSSWNYETMMGNGIAFAMEPALRRLPGGPNGEQYRAAVGRESRYFNAHPYLAGLAVGALARAELEGDTVSRIERFRAACCGPLGSVGDTLVWAGWLPLCSLVALIAFGAGVGPLGVVVVFLATYNVGHIALRAWVLEAGWRHGLKIAPTLGHPVFRQGPAFIARATAAIAGVAIPLAVARIVGAHPAALAAALAVALAWTFGTALIAKRADGWRAALIGVAAYTLFSIVP
ncbi:MAG TPA: PTS system mannose/fructose/sorbose family transporter subunit IID [Gemmatimonadaceae bacterium]|nr:PTS system mannose/fructose/sorbose family transporter subunit IID [Gemmatimonadaceae bacterium]